jgi:hypothetical protein
MRLSSATKLLLMVLFALFTVAPAPAVTPDPKLLSLVPPAVRVVAGMTAPSRSQPNSFLMITRNNSIDLDDFIALTGVDSTRVVEQVVLAAEDGQGTLTEHSLLASGHFDQGLIGRSVGGGSATRYRDIPVAVVQPFARELAHFNDVRWLAMIDSNVMLFGTIAMVKQELDRYLSGSVAEPFLVQKLARLQRDDDTWCVLTRLASSNEMRSALELLDANLADSLQGLQDGDTFQFGIRYGRRVEFDYEFNMSTIADAEAASKSLARSLAGPDVKEFSRLSAFDASQADGVIHGALKVSRARYDAWIAEVKARANLRVAAMLRDTTTNLH